MIEKFGEDLYLLERIAAGGMAEVYRAKQLGYGGFEKTVALKRILPNFAQNDEFKQMFRQEANLSGSLQHQNIAQVFSNGEHKGYLFLVMEFVDGKNVRQILARADKRKIKIPIELALYIVAESARGLQYAHDHVDEKTGQHLEIVHRDMSPQNIMLGYDSSVKVVDFGIAKAAARTGQTRAGVLKGKFGYMSPEQAQGGHIDKRTDIFALGIILFELLTQRRLFTAEDDLKTLQLVRDCRVPRPSKYNPEVKDSLDSIVLKALSKERTDRFETAGEFYAEITRFLVQNFPKHLPTDLGKFVKSIFEEDIKEEKRRRDKINAELPARLAVPPSKEPKSVEPKEEEFGEVDVSATGQTESTKGTEKTAKDEITATAKTGEGTQGKTLSDMPEQGRPTPSRPSLPPPPSKRPSSWSQRRELSMMSFDKEEASIKSLSQSGVISSTGSRPSIHQTGISSVRLQKALEPGVVLRKKIIRISSRVAFLGLLVLGFFKLSEYAKIPEVQQKIVAELKILNPEIGSKFEICLNTGFQNCTASERAPASEPEADTQADRIGEKGPDKAPQEEPKKVSDLEPQRDVAPPVAQSQPPKKNEIDGKIQEVESFKTWKPSEIPLKVVGYLTLNSTPEANEIVINNRKLVDEEGKPLRTPLKDFALPPGKYQIRLRSTFFEVGYKGEFSVEKNKINTVEVFLKK
jgi:serine/threonine protein kinase